MQLKKLVHNAGVGFDLTAVDDSEVSKVLAQGFGSFYTRCQTKEMYERMIIRRRYIFISLYSSATVHHCSLNNIKNILNLISLASLSIQ